MILKLILKVFPLPLFPDVCTAADGVESLRVGLENGHSHCAHRPVQHSKVGGARVWGWECVCVCQRESMSFASQTSTHSTFLSQGLFVCVHTACMLWSVCSCPLADLAAVELSVAALSITIIITISHHSHQYKNSLLLAYRWDPEKRLALPRTAYSILVTYSCVCPVLDWIIVSCN